MATDDPQILKALSVKVSSDKDFCLKFQPINDCDTFCPVPVIQATQESPPTAEPLPFLAHLDVITPSRLGHTTILDAFRGIATPSAPTDFDSDRLCPCGEPRP